MNTTQKIGKNIFSLTAGSFVSAILSIILSVFIARFLGDVLFGRYSFVVTFVALFSIFLDLGYEMSNLFIKIEKLSNLLFYISSHLFQYNFLKEH